jgi:threonine synthase
MKPPWFRCVSCQQEHALAERYRCPSCGGELAIQYDLDAIRRAGTFAATWENPGSIWRRFGALLPQIDHSRIVSLGEGSTPLVESPRLAARFGLGALYFKLESSNPTGSFKDRQISIAISKAMEWGRTSFGTASSGNVGVSLAAYAARAGARAYVWVSESVAAAKRRQIEVYGARLFLTPPTTPANNALNHAFFTGMRRFCVDRGIVPMVSARPVNPFVVEGSKTIAFETVAELGRVPDRLFGPVGGGGFMGGVATGYRDLVSLGLADRVPHLEGAQMVKGHVPIDRLDDASFDPREHFRPLDGEWAWASIQESRGALSLVDPGEIRAAQADLAVSEGIFAEPQGIAGFAGLRQAAARGRLFPDEVVVCVVTGTGLKDLDAAREMIERHPAAPVPRAVRTLDESADYLT